LHCLNIEYENKKEENIFQKKLEDFTPCQADKDDRAREKEEDRIERANARAEDMRKIEEMIITGVKEEVFAVLKPLQDSIDKQERVVEELTNQLTSVMKEMETLKASVNSNSEFPILQHPTSNHPSQPIQQHHVQGHHEQQAVQVDGPVRGVLEKSGAGRDRVKQIYSDARRVIGLAPIEPRMQSYGAKDIQEAMHMEVKNYLKCVMKVKPSVIEQLDIVKVFHPAKDDWNTLYLELGHELEVDLLYTHTKNITKQDHRVFPYIPKEMYRRYRAAESHLYNVRHEDKVKTKVKIGLADLVLSIKVPGSS
jgi:hypothetical protein